MIELQDLDQGVFSCWDDGLFFRLKVCVCLAHVIFRYFFCHVFNVVVDHNFFGAEISIVEYKHKESSNDDDEWMNELYSERHAEKWVLASKLSSSTCSTHSMLISVFMHEREVNQTTKIMPLSSYSESSLLHPKYAGKLI